MQVPIQIAFENIEPSAAVEAHVGKEAVKLEKYYERITSARIVIARPNHRHHKGDAYEIRLHLTVPGAADIAISRESNTHASAQQDIGITIRDAFNAARRQLQDLARKRQGHVKDHGPRLRSATGAASSEESE
jgi:ribosome-associated translation inhibitor RaiA